MTIYDKDEVLAALCKSADKWGMVASMDTAPAGHEQVEDSAEWLLDRDDYIDIACDGICYLLFDTEEEAEACLEATKCDEAAWPVYAATCNPQGEFENENT